jgi:hypothetical protein
MFSVYIDSYFLSATAAGRTRAYARDPDYPLSCVV